MVSVTSLPSLMDQGVYVPPEEYRKEQRTLETHLKLVEG